VRRPGTARPDRPAVAVVVAVTVASGVGGVALTTVVGGFPHSPSVLPVLVTTGVGAAMTALVLRTRLLASLAAAAGALAVLLSAVVTTVPGSTTLGFPGTTTVHLLRQDAAASQASLRAPGIPYHAVPGVVVLAAVAAGMLALASQLVLATRRRGSHRPPDGRAAALVPPLGLVAWAGAVGTVGTATLLAVGMVAVAAVTLALPVRGVPAPSGSAGRPGRHRPGGGALVVTAVAMVAVAVTGAGVATAVPSTGVATGNDGGSAGATSELRLLSSVVALERHDPAAVVFTAASAVPTYWEVGALTSYQDGTWSPSAAMQAAATGVAVPAPGAPVLPATSRGRFGVEVTMASLTGRLLPLPPDTVSVDAPFPVVRTAGGTAAHRGVAAGDRYTAVALLPSAVSTRTTDPGGSLPPADAAETTSLPPLPPAIHTLASAVTAGTGDPLTEAAQLENWFRSGSFHYALDPPAPPVGVDPLVGFLTDTRTGNCEQFAGAFAVLARSVGLPARVMVGFTAGLRSSDGTTLVRGVDAHAWPEVYVGAGQGWVSFEPTPGQATGEPLPSDVVGPTRIVAPPAAVTPGPTPPATAVTTPSTVPTTTPSTVPTTRPVAPTTTPTSPPATTSTSAVPRRGPPTTRGARSAPASAHWPLIVLGALAVSVAVTLVWIWVRRRRRRRSPVRPVPGTGRLQGPFAVAWRRIDRSLADAGLARPTWLSPAAQARAIGGLAEPRPGPDDLPGTVTPSPGGLRSVATDVARVADLLERSVFGGETFDPAVVAEAEAASQRVRRTLRRVDVRRRLHGPASEVPARRQVTRV